MHKRFTRGFTLIELLVVIAIIGILAGIVLASLGSARGKATDAQIKEQLGNIRSAAEIYYATNNSYGTAGTAGVCSGGTAGTMWQDVSSNMLSLASSTQTNAQGAGNVDCGASQAAWALAVKLPSAGTWWCVDSTGAARGVASTTGVAYTALTGATGAKPSAGNVQCN